jgi:hypothetical protein
MTTLAFIKTLLKNTGFYWKKFLIFLLFLGVGVGGYFLWRSQSPTEAAIQFSNVPQYSSESQRTVDIVIRANGQILINGKSTPSALTIYPDYYEVRLLVFDNPGVFIDSTTVTMHLPAPVAQDQIEPIVYAVHGVSSYNAYLADPETLVFQANDIAPTATLTVVAHLPKSILVPSLSKRIIYDIANIPARSFLIVAIALPAVSFCLMLFMIFKRRKDQLISLRVKPIPSPPQALSPAVAGVLIDGQVGAREIAATLIDLALRGFIFITKNKGRFSFGIRKSLNLDELKIKPFEKKLLSKLFEKQNFRSTKADVEMRVGRHIFSRKIADTYLAIYNEATNLGYFVKNPAQIHRRWRYAGITLFFLGLLGFFYSAAFTADPKFTLFFWVGEIAAAAVIIKFAGLMPIRSSLGSAALSQWMGFRKYLKLKANIEPGANIEEKYVKYLPYAIVYGVEAEWTRRFLKEPYVKPDWYESNQPVSTLENFAGGLFPLISFVGTILDKSHEPTVE